MTAEETGRSRRSPRFARCRDRRHLRHHRGDQRGYSRRRSGLVQPRPGQPETERAARRAAAHRTDRRRRRRSGVRAGRRACGSCARPSPALQRAVSGAGMPSQYSRRERRGLGRRPAGADARRRVARQHQPRPLPAGLHGVRRAARRLPSVLADPDPARARARLRASPATICAARSSGRGLSAILLEPVQPDRQGHRRRASSPRGSPSAASSTAR